MASSFPVDLRICSLQCSVINTMLLEAEWTQLGLEEPVPKPTTWGKCLLLPLLYSLTTPADEAL